MRIFIRRLIASRFFMTSLLVHTGILLMVGTWVVYDAIEVKDPPKIVWIDNEDGKNGLNELPEPEPELPNPHTTETKPTETTQGEQSPVTEETVNTAIETAIKNAITSENRDITTYLSPETVQVGMGEIRDQKRPTVKAPPLTSKREVRIDMNRLQAVADHVRGFNLKNTQAGVRGLKARFTCHVAVYDGGDWNHNIRLDPSGQRITFGSIPNLMTQINRWNKGLEANVEGRPLRLSSEDLFKRDPPVAFVYMTGHQNFRLTEEEVRNLQRFIVQGGVIWGDNGLPGKNSRFDIAFRREMRRVLPDPDQEFVELDDKHPIYTQKGSFISSTPSGINFYRHSVEAVLVDGKLGVIYTPNSYGDLWQVALDRQDRVLEVFDEGTDKSPNETYTSARIWSRRNSYYRNVSAPTVADAYKLGINIIACILTQYQEEVSKMPTLTGEIH